MVVLEVVLDVDVDAIANLRRKFQPIEHKLPERKSLRALAVLRNRNHNVSGHEPVIKLCLTQLVLLLGKVRRANSYDRDEPEHEHGVRSE